MVIWIMFFGMMLDGWGAVAEGDVDDVFWDDVGWMGCCFGE